MTDRELNQLERMSRAIAASRSVDPTELKAGAIEAADKILRAISQIDISRHARAAGDLGSAESALDVARRELCEVLGIKESP